MNDWRAERKPDRDTNKHNETVNMLKGCLEWHIAIWNQQQRVCYSCLKNDGVLILKIQSSEKCTRYIAGTGGLTSSVSTLFPEEAVNEVKRQAMSELQKAVSEAERKAHEMISSERAKMERTVAEAKRQAAEEALSIINQQEDSSEVEANVHILSLSSSVSLSSFCVWLLMQAVVDYTDAVGFLLLF